MNNELMISVIVPVYNGEKTIRRAVDSVLCQMDGRIELILVNDGSTDNSGAICNEYASSNEHVHVIHKKNGGTSSAKNMGIELAKGNYLSFMDCDDFFEADTFSQIIPILLKHQPDCLDFGWKYVNVCGEVSEAFHHCKKNTLMTQQDLDMIILPPLLNLCKDDDHFVFDFCWNKIFKTEIIKAFKVRFDEDKCTWEDRTFLLRHLRHCQNYYSMDRCFYNYMYTSNSLSQRYTLDFFRIILENFSHYQELFEDRFDFDTQYTNEYRVRSIENMIIRSLEQQEEKQIIRSNILHTLQNEKVIYWFTRWAPSNSNDIKIRSLVVSGEYKKALKQYLRRVSKMRRQRVVLNIKNRIKRCVRKMWGGKRQ